MSKNDIIRKRSVLFSARMRFSPEMQPVRQTAIDKILEQNLLAANSPSGLTLKELENQGAFCFAGGAPAISRVDIELSLGRLEQNNKVVLKGMGKHRKCKLSDDATNELWKLQESTENRFSRVVERRVSRFLRLRSGQVF